MIIETGTAKRPCCPIGKHRDYWDLLRSHARQLLFYENGKLKRRVKVGIALLMIWAAGPTYSAWNYGGIYLGLAVFAWCIFPALLMLLRILERGL